jgi:hypothetical protein
MKKGEKNYLWDISYFASVAEYLENSLIFKRFSREILKLAIWLEVETCEIIKLCQMNESNNQI